MAISRRGRLLPVEDENLLRGLISRFLQIEGHDVVEAENGRRGIDLYLNASPFDLVIVDLELPECSGVEVCRAIRNKTPDQPILVCSAAILDPHFSALVALSVDRYLTKPYLPTDLLSEIDFALNHATNTVPPTGRSFTRSLSRRSTVCSQS